MTDESVCEESVCEEGVREEGVPEEGVPEEGVREEGVREENIRSVRLGHGANCSSVGSVIDTLFLGATLGGVVFAAVCAAMKVEGVTVVGAAAPKGEPAADAEEEEKGGPPP
jgi:hypothetical protein